MDVCGVWAYLGLVCWNPDSETNVSLQFYRFLDLGVT